MVANVPSTGSDHVPLVASKTLAVFGVTTQYIPVWWGGGGVVWQSRAGAVAREMREVGWLEHGTNSTVVYVTATAASLAEMS